jgi:hypothetical protein
MNLMNFIFAIEWWKQYSTNEHSEWVKYYFIPRRQNSYLKTISISWYSFYDCPVDNINLWSIMLNVSTKYIILSKLKEYLRIILVFACSIFVLCTNKCCFSIEHANTKIGSRLLDKRRHFENKTFGGKWSRDRHLHSWSYGKYLAVYFMVPHCLYVINPVMNKTKVDIKFLAI